MNTIWTPSSSPHIWRTVSSGHWSSWSSSSNRSLGRYRSANSSIACIVILSVSTSSPTVIPSPASQSAGRSRPGPVSTLHHSRRARQVVRAERPETRRRWPNGARPQTRPSPGACGGSPAQQASAFGLTGVGTGGAHARPSAGAPDARGQPDDHGVGGDVVAHNRARTLRGLNGRPDLRRPLPERLVERVLIAQAAQQAPTGPGDLQGVQRQVLVLGHPDL